MSSLHTVHLVPACFADAAYSPIINCMLGDELLSSLDCCRGKEKQTCIQADYMTVTGIP